MDLHTAAASGINEENDVKSTLASNTSMDEDVDTNKEAEYTIHHCFVTSQNEEGSCIEKPFKEDVNSNVSRDEDSIRIEQKNVKVSQINEDSVIKARNKIDKDVKEDISAKVCTDVILEKGHEEPSIDNINSVIDRLRLDDINNQTFQTDGISTKYFNRRFLDRNATTYELERFTKNKMLIFNQENCLGETPREGTDKDVATLEACFKKRAFEVECFHDCTKDELFDNLEKTIGQDLSDYGCFAVVILTHGSYDGLLMTRDRPFYESQIVDALKASNAPVLLTKPKILIIQACRGDGISRAAPVGQTWHSAPYQHDSLRNKNYAYTMAEESDFLIIHSTFSGMKAHRGKEYGTWFIQSLCKFINESEHCEDMSAILTRVRRDVSINHENSCFTDEDKQMPEVTTTLTRTLYLNSGVQITKKDSNACVEIAPLAPPSKSAGKVENVERPENVEAKTSEENSSSNDKESDVDLLFPFLRHLDKRIIRINGTKLHKRIKKI